MNFSFTQEEEELRREVRTFVNTYVTADLLRELKEERDTGRRGALAQAFFGNVREAGYMALSWPKEFGGQGRSPMAQFIVEEEFYRTTEWRIGAAGSGAPAILASGTEEQKRHFLPAVISREITFAQGYTEPGCGSDLAGIQCRARRVDDKYVIKGQKIYVTDAHTATHIFLMVRTDPASRRHQGLSILLVPMNTVGITVRPLWTIQNEPQAPLGTTYGERRVNEVFFEDVEVPASSLLGEEGDGWAVATRGLNLDRVGAFRYVISIMRDEDIVNWLNNDEFGTTKRDDAVVRDKVAEMWIEAQVCRLMTMRSLSIAQHGADFSYEGSAEKVWAPEHGVRSSEAFSQIVGPHAQPLEQFARRGRGRLVCAQPAGCIPIHRQPRQRACDARPGRAARARDAALDPIGEASWIYWSTTTNEWSWTRQGPSFLKPVRRPLFGPANRNLSTHRIFGRRS